MPAISFESCIGTKANTMQKRYWGIMQIMLYHFQTKSKKSSKKLSKKLPITLSKKFVWKITKLSKYLPQTLFKASPNHHLSLKNNNKNGLLFQILEALLAKQEGSKLKNKAMKQKHSPSQSAPTILVYQVDLIFFQGLELFKKGPKYGLQKAGCKTQGHCY